MTLRPVPFHAVPGAPEAIGRRVARLQAEARGLAVEHVAALVASLTVAGRLASEIASGGEAYPAGVRDLARRLADDIEVRAGTLTALSTRAG